ncbi:hypothetical protein C8F01DRAFT_1374741 [Mycena amicta]|nr:hypothetical protein C8F01DRAFT_1374741 [Mycena amicta]
MTTPRSEACLPLLPQDILSEVCAYLGPQELYNLSKTAKQLRIFLTSRSNAGPIWRRAFHRAVDADGLPRASPGVQCDLQWAELLYGRSCSACLINLENPLQYTFWPFNVRLCTNCFPSLVQRRLPPDLARRVRTEYWSGLFPSVSQTHTQTSLYLSREVETFKRRASSLTRDELEQFLIQQRQLTTLKMEHAKTCESWRTSNSSGDSPLPVWCGDHLLVRDTSSRWDWLSRTISRIPWYPSTLPSIAI